MRGRPWLTVLMRGRPWLTVREATSINPNGACPQTRCLGQWGKGWGSGGVKAPLGFTRQTIEGANKNRLQPALCLWVIASSLLTTIPAIEDCTYSGLRGSLHTWTPGKDCRHTNCSSTKWPYPCDIRNYDENYPTACDDAKDFLERQKQEHQNRTSSMQEPCQAKLASIGLYIYSCRLTDQGGAGKAGNQMDEISLKFSFKPPYCDRRTDDSVMAQFNSKYDSGHPYYIEHHICRVFNFSSQPAREAAFSADSVPSINYDCIGIGLQHTYPEVYYYLGLTTLPTGSLLNYTIVFLDKKSESMRLAAATWLSPNKVHCVFLPIEGVSFYQVQAKAGDWTEIKHIYVRPTDKKNCAVNNCSGAQITVHKEGMQFKVEGSTVPSGGPTVSACVIWLQKSSAASKLLKAMEKKGVGLQRMPDIEHGHLISKEVSIILILLQEPASGDSEQVELFTTRLKEIFSYRPCWEKIKVVVLSHKKVFPRHLLESYKIKSPMWAHFMDILDEKERLYYWPAEEKKLVEGLRSSGFTGQTPPDYAVGSSEFGGQEENSSLDGSDIETVSIITNPGEPPNVQFQRNAQQRHLTVEVHPFEHALTVQEQLWLLGGHNNGAIPFTTDEDEEEHTSHNSDAPNSLGEEPINGDDVPQEGSNPVEPCETSSLQVPCPQTASYDPEETFVKSYHPSDDYSPSGQIVENVAPECGGVPGTRERSPVENDENHRTSSLGQVTQAADPREPERQNEEMLHPLHPAVSRRPPPATHSLEVQRGSIPQSVCGDNQQLPSTRAESVENSCLQELRNGTQHLTPGLPSVHNLPSSRRHPAGEPFDQAPATQRSNQFSDPHHRYRVPPQAFPSANEHSSSHDSHWHQSPPFPMHFANHRFERERVPPDQVSLLQPIPACSGPSQNIPATLQNGDRSDPSSSNPPTASYGSGVENPHIRHRPPVQDEIQRRWLEPTEDSYHSRSSDSGLQGSNSRSQSYSASGGQLPLPLMDIIPVRLPNFEQLNDPLDVESLNGEQNREAGVEDGLQNNMGGQRVPVQHGDVSDEENESDSGVHSSGRMSSEDYSR
ncbi:hypothetical protein BaRGS_00034604 [Batillaria attramentaria]|uniref:SEFIR domain-containing protein n=2 Tax=Batillaria attramentaria TaxID=370345 RepID=A0ABD0JGL7_9CAEN